MFQVREREGKNTNMYTKTSSSSFSNEGNFMNEDEFLKIPRIISRAFQQSQFQLIFFLNDEIGICFNKKSGARRRMKNKR